MLLYFVLVFTICRSDFDLIKKSSLFIYCLSSAVNTLLGIARI